MASESSKSSSDNVITLKNNLILSLSFLSCHTKKESLGGGGGKEPGPPILVTTKITSVFFNKRTIKVCVGRSWQCPETFTLSAKHLTVSLYQCDSGCNAPDGDKGVVLRNRREWPVRY